MLLLQVTAEWPVLSLPTGSTGREGQCLEPCVGRPCPAPAPQACPVPRPCSWPCWAVGTNPTWPCRLPLLGLQCQHCQKPGRGSSWAGGPSTQAGMPEARTHGLPGHSREGPVSATAGRTSWRGRQQGAGAARLECTRGSGLTCLLPAA